MHRSRRAWTQLLMGSLGLMLWVGCDATGTNEVERQYVVEAYLMAGEALPPVRLTRTASTDRSAGYDARAVEGADVAVTLLDEAGTPVVRYPYRALADTTGVYVPFERYRVFPLHTYRLEVTPPGEDDRITATTTVPDTFRIARVNAREVEYQGARQLALTLTPSRYPGRDQSFYIFSTEALAPEAENLTPLLREVIENAGDDVSLGSLRVTSSPIINAASYDKNPDGTRTVRLPWVAVAFFGPNRTIINAIDDNLYDFVRTQSAQQGGAGLTPGTIPNVIDHIDGGTGIFGSLARRSYEVEVRRPQ